MWHRMSLPSPFTRENVITAAMDILNSYPEDERAKIAKYSLGRLRQRLGYSPPEYKDKNFWTSSKDYTGFYDICRAFDEQGPRSDNMNSLYMRACIKYRADGFFTYTRTSTK